MASASSSSPFFGIRDEDLQNQIKQQQQQKPTSSASAPAAAPVKKRRNQPGNPSPDAEVIALSPKTLMATNRFICEVCNKGFQREQNLQLHRRGHNLPWKLKQKSGKEHEVRRRVYLCPEPSCVHHHPSRALGDLTGIKKHFCRKHGEKKWKCDKCSKRYAVHSDLKAHAKTCGTREYRCDCGTLFSRRDSFITHRAFCDALAQESTRQPAAGVVAATGFSSLGSHLFRNNTASMAAFGGLSQVNTQLASLQDQTHPSTDLLRLGGARGAASQFEHLLGPTNPHPFRPAQPPQPPFFLDAGSNHPDFNNPELQTKPFQGLMHLPDLQGSAASAPNLFNLNSSSSTNTNNNNNAVNGGGQQNHLPFSGGNLITDHVGGESLTSIYNAAMQNEPLLPQMSATALLQKAAQMGSTASGGATCTGTGAGLLRGFSGTGPHTQMDHSETQLTNLMNSLANGGASGLFSVGFGPYVDGGLCIDDMDETKYNLCNNVGLNLGAGSDRLTRDFLGVGGMVRMPRALDPELRSQSSSRSFGSGSLQ